MGPELAKMREFKASVETMALRVAKSQGLDKDERFTSGDYQGNLLGLALHSCSFYQCNKCEIAYFGGMIDCQADLGIEESTNKEDLLCKNC